VRVLIDWLRVEMPKGQLQSVTATVPYGNLPVVPSSSGGVSK